MYESEGLLFALIAILFYLWPVWLIIFLIWLSRRSKQKYQADLAAYQAQKAAQGAPGVITASTDTVDRAKLVAHLERQLAEARQHAGQSWKIGGLEEAIRSVKTFGAVVQWDLPPVVVSAPTTAPPVYFQTAQPQSASHKTDNALTLLYLGAFLFIAAVALFVLLADVGGITKTFLILLTAGLLYGGGFWLNAGSKNLQAAAPAFLAMGIGTLPFAGLAMNRYLYADAGGTWLLISVIALAMSIYAVNTTKAQVIGYLTAFAWFSLLASSLTVVDAPVYMYMWALVIAAILLRLYLEYAHKVPGDDRVPFEHTVQTTVPTAILGALIVGGWSNLELWHIAVTIALSAAYYLMLVRYSTEPTRSTYAALGHLLLLAAAVLTTLDLTDGTAKALGLLCASLATLQLLAIVSPLYGWLGATDYRRFLYGLTAILPLAAALFLLGERDLLISSLVLASLVAGSLLRRSYSTMAALPLMAAALALPFAIGWYKLDESWEPMVMLALFLLTAIALWLPRHYARDEQLNPVWRTGYMTALAFGFLWVVCAGSTTELAWTSLFFAGLAAVISFYERQAVSIIAVPLLLTLSLERFLTIAAASVLDNLVLASFSIGVLSYVSSYVLSSLGEQRRRSLAYTGVALLVLTWLLASSTEAIHELFGPTALLLASLAAYLEAKKRAGGSLGGELLSIAGMMLAFQLGLNALTDGELDVLVYSHLWAAYLVFTYLQVKRRVSPQNATPLKYLALAVFTLPLVFKALDDSSYGLLLLAEHALLAIIGEMLKRREIVKWAVIVTILAVVYMLRDFTFLNIGLIAVLLIGYSIYRLSKNSADNH